MNILIILIAIVFAIWILVAIIKSYKKTRLNMQIIKGKYFEKCERETGDSSGRFVYNVEELKVRYVFYFFLWSVIYSLPVLILTLIISAIADKAFLPINFVLVAGFMLSVAVSFVMYLF